MSIQREAPTSSDAGSARSRNLVRGIVSSFLSRGVAALVPLAMIPVVLPELGASTYGAWMTIVSITAMLVWADLGLGNGLLTRLSAHLSKDDRLSARRDILATYSIVAVVGGILSILTLASPLVVSWPRILNAGGSSADAVTPIALVCMLSFWANMPLSLIQRVQYAAQQVGISNAFTATGPVISLLLTLWATGSDQTPVLIVFSATVGPLIANLAATAWFFSRNPSLIPRLADRRGAQPLALLSLGGLFVLITMFSSLASNSDSMVIAHTLGAVQVADFAVAARVMASMGLVISLVNLPFWPATANALARGDTAWVHRTTRRMALLSGTFVALPTVAIMAISDPLVGALSQGLVERDLLLIGCLGAWWAIVAVTSPMMMVQNAAGVLLPQLIGWVLFLSVSLPIKVFAVPQLGVFAGPLVGAIAYCVLVLPFALWGYRRSMALAKAKATNQAASSADQAPKDDVAGL